MDETSIEIPSDGRVRADDFPFIIMTNNGERDFPPAFRRRCLPLEIFRPRGEKLRSIVKRHLGEAAEQDERVAALIKDFDNEHEVLRATDQLLNAIQLVVALDLDEGEWNRMKDNILRPMNELPSLEPSE
jgi:MoxR-like ATPase